MPHSLPQNDLLSTDKLSTVFDSTLSSYKYFWFVSLIQQLSEKKQSRDNSERGCSKNDMQCLVSCKLLQTELWT